MAEDILLQFEDAIVPSTAADYLSHNIQSTHYSMVSARSSVPYKPPKRSPVPRPQSRGPRPQCRGPRPQSRGPRQPRLFLSHVNSNGPYPGSIKLNKRITVPRPQSRGPRPQSRGPRPQSRGPRPQSRGPRGPRMNKGLYFGSIAPRQKRDFDMRPDDVIVASYPRCGTTWTIEILRRIHLLRITDSNHYLHNSDNKVHGIWIDPNPHNTAGPRTKQEFDQYASPRVTKCHLPYNDLPCPEGGICKIVHVSRDPADVICSQYIHAKDANHTRDFNTFVNTFISGNLGCGDWWHRTQSYLNNIHQLPTLFLKYSELKSNSEGSIIKINEFLGYPALTDHQLAQIKYQTSYEVMRISHGDTIHGSVDKPVLSEDQRRRIEDKTRRYFGLNVIF